MSHNSGDFEQIWWHRNWHYWSGHGSAVSQLIWRGETAASPYIIPMQRVDITTNFVSGTIEI
jgi:hypothetical protein